jgi:hypothetical protein
MSTKAKECIRDRHSSIDNIPLPTKHQISRRKDIPQSLKEITMTLPRKQLVAVEDTPITMLFRAVNAAVTCAELILIEVKAMGIADSG